MNPLRAARAARSARLAALALVGLSLLLAAPARAQDGAEPGGEGVATTAESPLAPAPTGSPRQTFQSFRSLAQGAANALMEAFERSEADDVLFDTAEVRALKRRAIDDLQRAASTMDLSAVPPANRRTVGVTSVLLLEEIMDRIPLPDIAAIPDEAAVDAGEAPNGWTVPGTEIRMSRTTSPDGEPRFLFSAETVERLPAFYARVRHLPRHADEQLDFYQHFVAAPGLSIPIEFYRYILDLPPWLRTVHGEQAVWQWIALGVLTALVAGAIALVLRWEGRRAQSISPVRRSLRRLVPPIVVIGFLALYDWLVDDFVNLTGDFLADLELLVSSLQSIAFAVLAVLVFNLLAALVIASPRIRKESLDASLIRLVLRVVGIGVAGYILFVGATRIGIPVYGIVAGLGVGGLAIALAVRPTLENFIGGIILYADRPVKVGDFCKFGEMLGTVEEIGLRSTKIRSLDRTLVTVQNAEFAQMSIVNFTRRDANLMHTTFGLRYETTAEQLEGVIEGVAAMLGADDRVDAQTVRVCFRGFGEYALQVEIWAYVNCADWGGFLKIQEELFMKVMAVVENNGAAFALPSQTTYLGSDRPPGRPIAPPAALSGTGPAGTAEPAPGDALSKGAA